MKDVHRLEHFGVRLEDFSNGGFIVHHNSESPLIVEGKSEKNIHQPFMELKKSVIGKLKESLSLGGMVS